MNNSNTAVQPIEVMDSMQQQSAKWTEAPMAEHTDVEESTEKKTASVLELFRQYASLSDLLRYGGALSVAVAMAVFLMEGAQSLTDIQRFLSMLGFTGLLTAAGFIMTLLLKEQRGSRVFIALALLSVPVNFTVFGALLYSFVPLDGIAGQYPQFAKWSAAGWADVSLAISAGLAVLVPVVWAGYTVLARSERRWLSAALLLGSVSLVIPVRQELVVAVIALLVAAASGWMIHRYSKESLVMKTGEGRFAKSLLFVAPLIIIARSMFLYQAGGALLLMLSVGIYFAVRQLLISRNQGNWFTAAATLFAFVITFGISASAFEITENLIRNEYAVVFATCVFLAISADLARVSPNKKLANSLGVFGVLLSACLLAALALFEGGSTLTLLCVGVLVVAAIIGYMLQYPSVSVICVAALAAISVTYIENIWSMAVGTGWWGIAALGVIAIIAGSVVDRAGTVVKTVEA